MKKRVLAGILAAALSASFFMGCGDTKEAATEATEEVAEADEEVSEPEAQVEEEQGDSISLPAYEYPGPEIFYAAVYAYVVDEFGKYYSQADVTIPSISIFAEDESDNEDIKVYADFSVYNYTLDGKTLMMESGGSHPGVMHLKFTGEDYEVTAFDAVADGSDFDDSAKEIFGEHYDDFAKIYSDSEAKETIRAQIISNYVFANNLDITSYQDPGWDPMELPEQNIDSFYSVLN